jgi:hypothetical protein
LSLQRSEGMSVSVKKQLAFFIPICARAQPGMEVGVTEND